MIRKTWHQQVFTHAILEAKPDPTPKNPTRRTVTLKNIYNHLPEMVKNVKSQGQTPKSTIRRSIQDIRDFGLLQMVDKRGKYELLPVKFSPETFFNKQKMSRGEQLVMNVLEELGIPYESQKRFVDLKYKSYLSFDFYFELRGKKFFIEFDGGQHDLPVKKFGGEPAFRTQQIRDAIKTQYAEKRGQIIRIKKLNVQTIHTTIVKRIADVFEIKEEKVPDFIESAVNLESTHL